MSSEEKSDFEKYRKMYYNRLKEVPALNNNVPTTHQTNVSLARGQPTGPGWLDAYSAGVSSVGHGSAPVRTILDKRTYEQAYRDSFERKKKSIIYKAPEKTRFPESGPSGIEKQTQYTTTVYNITPHDVSHAAQPKGTFIMPGKAAPGAVPGGAHVAKPPTVSAIQPTMEGISYQKTQSNAYAKQLVEITKLNMEKIDIPNARGDTNPSVILNFRNQTDLHAKNSSLDQSTSVVQNFPPHRTYPGMLQEEVMRRLQAKQERRQAPNPSLKTFAQNGETVVISKHRSNIMLSIVNPTVTRPAPVHVYGAPGWGAEELRHSTHPYNNNSNGEEGGSNTTGRLQSELKKYSNCRTEPPPAHSTTNAPFPKPNVVSEVSDAGYGKPDPHYSQDEVLNLDTKHSETQSAHGIPSPTAGTQVQTSAALTPVRQNVELPTTSHDPEAIWKHLQNRNLQQVLAQVQATQQPQQRALPSEMDRAAMINLQLQATLLAAQQCLEPKQSSNLAYFDLPDASPNSTAISFQRMLGSTVPERPKGGATIKRKSTGTDADPAGKRKPKPKRNKRPIEPYLQNGPCFTVAPRLPRCRECGRSAATRSRHALNIFCRFYAFRKLKYNEAGQLEVVGFADPHLDPKETDTSLWSANLQQVPVDLSIEKAKFLLGQVGYKFCELFHQEKEAHFEHLSEDKTIAWKQAVQGVREMCDVCQTTLFNHHWVCTTCGFVVCIDCYKCRKRGSSTNESTTKDKDPHGWLLCTSNKAPHSQDQLMLTQIIPSNCLYKLVRQMHGICALLEIPLNCECPLSKEPRFRKIKDKLEFIYPITVDEKQSGDDVFYDFNGPMHAPHVKVTRMVSITIKHIEQVTHRGDDGVDNGEPIGCRIEFSKQFHENEPRGGTPTSETGQEDGANEEKQSYSFESFQSEIHVDGDHFDESLYSVKARTKSEPEAPKLPDSSGATNEDASVQIDATSSNGNDSNNLASNSDRDLNSSGVECAADAIKEEAIQAIPGPVPSEAIALDAVSKQGAISDECRTATDGEEQHRMGTSTDVPLGQAPDDVQREETVKAVNVVKKERSGTTEQRSKMAIPPGVPYSEEGRLKPSPPMDPKTFAMIVKQMVKFDKTVDIFGTFERHMACETGPLGDFVECITVQPDRVRRFLVDFLDDFVYLRGQHRSDDLTNERQLVEYNRHIKDGRKFRNKGERRMHLNESNALYAEVAHEWLCNGKLLRLLDPLDVHNYQSFHDQWERGQPVMVSAVASKMNMDLWIPEAFGRDFGEQVNDLVNCFNGKIVRGQPMKVFWEGFEQIRGRLVDDRERPMMLKLKDWPPGDDFAEMLPTRFYDLMRSLPLAEYTRREGRLNLASRLNSFFVRPDLGPKMYSAYGSALHPNKGTTNLHLDMSDAVNVMVYVGVPTDVPRARYNEKILEVINAEDCDYLTRQRIGARKELPGALWHIFHAQDADKIRQLLNKIELERGGSIKPNHDPIHDQKWYLDRNMRRRLQQEYGVDGYAIVQCAGDAIFIPAGAPHQVRNLHNCIKVAEDFVSPENISYCFKLTNEFRHLSKTHSNHEDKLQIKNIIYHTVKDAVSSITTPLTMMGRDREQIEQQRM